MTGGYNNKNYDRWVKKKMTVDRRHRFNSISSVIDSSNTVVGDINSVAVVGDIDSAAIVGDIDSPAVIRDIDSTAVVKDTITTIGPPVMAVQWSETPIRWAIGPSPQAALLAKPSVLVVYLKYKFKLKSITIRENNKKLMNNEYFIEWSCKIDKLMWVFCKSNGVK